MRTSNESFFLALSLGEFLIDLVLGKKSAVLDLVRGSQPSPGRTSPGRGNDLGEVARILATGFLRLQASRCQTKAITEGGTSSQIPLASLGDKSDELAAGTTGRRPRCKRA
jgi:hypothetical protein